ncbi:MAG: endonuclease/exonuclease/phosphatase family protein [Gemmatimonadales bacterium]|nr:MAG: endonuclease/exonuclease/phosphatase family protein [Gemmatimonadales bacterium]
MLRWQASRVVRVSPLPEVGDGGVVSVPVADSLVVATWNVHVGGGDLPAFVADLRSGDLTGGFVPGPFVILLQEVHRQDTDAHGPAALRPGPTESVRGLHFRPPSGPRLDILQVARELELHLAYAPALPNGRATTDAPLEDRGVAILSSHPLNQLRVIELPRERQRRVALAGVFAGRTREGAPWQFQVASAHLENRTSWDRFMDSFGASRGRQAEVLARGLGDGPAIVGGDLNTWAPAFLEPALGILKEAFPQSPELDAPTFRVGAIARPLDHLLLRHPGSVRSSAEVVDHRYGSDHHPVIGIVELS